MRTNVLVTGTGGRSVGAGILHALLRSSREVKERWRVTAADSDPFAWGLYVAERAATLPSAASPDYMSKVADLVKKHQFAAIIPGTQPEAEVLARNVGHLRSVKLISNRPELLPLMSDKYLVEKTLKELGLPHIQTEAAKDWRKIAAAHGFPIVFKPTANSGGSKGVHLAADENEALFILSQLDQSSATCAQPYIGNPDSEYTVGVLSDVEGSLVDSIVMHRKLIGLSLLQSRTLNDRTYAISTGYSQGVFKKEPKIQDFCERLALLLRSRGPLNIQLRAAEDGTLYAFEIHPRFSGTTPMRADVGFNEVDLLLRSALFQEKLGRVSYRNNMAVIRAFEHVVVPVEDML